jgi:bacterioferritin-associated ferredoxin
MLRVALPIVIVCHCRVVTDGDITDALQDGARTVSEVCRRTGAGQNCGSCIFSVKQIVCQHGNPILSPVAEVSRAAS